MHTRNTLVESVNLLAIILIMQNQEALCGASVIDTTKPVPTNDNIVMCSKFLSRRLADICDNKVKISKRDASTLLVPLSEKVTLCSKFLSNGLADLCDKKISVAKRETSPLIGILMPNRREPTQRVRPIKLSRRSRRQISDECCDKPCSVEHLISYCPPNSLIYYR